jgi:hypothetical protein
MEEGKTEKGKDQEGTTHDSVLVSSPLSDEAFSDRLFRLHLAEYEALMNRCNYFIMLHLGALGLAPTVLVFVIQQVLTAKTEWQGYIIWLGALALQAILQVWVTLIEDQYNAVAYIERDLRQAIAKTGHIPPDHFWRYEKFLDLTRMRESWWGEYLAPVLLTLLLAVGVYWRQQMITVVELGLIISNGLLIAVLYVRTYLRVKVRKSFARNEGNRGDGSL